jgi:Zn2+/Cd2+-exporting ATPase
VTLGLAWTTLLIVLAAAGIFGSRGALFAAVLHNVGTLAVMLNAGQLLKFHEPEYALQAASA